MSDLELVMFLLLTPFRKWSSDYNYSNIHHIPLKSHGQNLKICMWPFIISNLPPKTRDKTYMAFGNLILLEKGFKYVLLGLSSRRWQISWNQHLFKVWWVIWFPISWKHSSYRWMDWANLGRPCLLVPTFKNPWFKEGVQMPHTLDIWLCLIEPVTFSYCNIDTTWTLVSLW